MADRNEAMENLFQAIDIITQERLTNLGYDKTIKATIIDDSKADKGEYIVSDGSSDFEACSNVKYSKGTNVYVIIPQGDYNNTKIIVGKYADETNSYNYANPTEDFLDVTHNLAQSAAEASLLANDPDRKFYTVWSIDGTNYQGYNRLALKGNFRTWLSSLDVVNGTYGLILYVVSRETLYNGNDFERTYKFALSSEDMYGNPFNYETYYLQEKVYDISNIPDIISMELIFYQDGDFLTAEGGLADYQEDGVKYPDNLFIQTPYVSLGYDLDDVEEDEVKLYTLDATTYDATYDDTALQKTLELRWLHVQDDGSIIAIDQEDEIPEDAEIRWYKYKLDRTICDKVAGTFWEEIGEARNKFSYSFCPDILVGSEKYKVIIECPSRDSVYESLSTTLGAVGSDVLKLSDSKEWKDSVGKIWTEQEVVENAAKSYSDNGLKSFQEYKQIIETFNKAFKIDNGGQEYPNYKAVSLILDKISKAQSNVKLFKSEVLEFINESYDPVSAAIDLVSGLKILVDTAGYNGTYLIYDESGLITNAAEGYKSRTLTASYTSLITGEETLDRAEKITWYFPLEQSMIYPPQKGTEYEDGYSVLDADKLKELELPCSYCSIERTIREYEGDAGDEMSRQVEQVFRIKDYYSQMAINNTIYCVVTKNGREYKASATLVFGTSGTNGAEVTFRLELREVEVENEAEKITDHPVTALTLHDTIGVVPRIYDYNNKEITDTYLTTNNMVSYSWCMWGPKANEKIGDLVIKTPSELSNSALISCKESTTKIEDCQYCILTATLPWEIVKYIYDDSGNLKYDKDGNPQIKGNTYDEEGNLEKEGDIETRKVELKTYLPIPVRSDENYTQVVGPTQIVYDSNGTNPTYYKMPFVLYENGQEIDAFWAGSCYEDSANEDILKFYPSIDVEGNLTPTTLYLTNDYPYAVNAYVSIVDENGKIKDQELIWTQPILIIKNKYSSAMLNSWDGDFVINEENGTIMGTMFGAGKKDDNNTFTGVLMGDIEAGAGIELKAGNKDGIGLYGFHQGEQSFGFNVDGTAFIGKVGRGRIIMDGTEGTIQSGSYTPYSSGMLIDLDGEDSVSASLSAYGPGGSFELNTNKNSPLLEIRSGPSLKSNTLFYIGQSRTNQDNIDFYLQSDNYVSGSNGTKINLKTGKIEIYNKGIGDSPSYIRIDGDGSPYLQVHDGGTNKDIFYASTTDYYLESTNFKSGESGIKIDLKNGSIDARSGVIGGWAINKSSLTAGGITLNSSGSITADGWSITSGGAANFSKGRIGPFNITDSSMTYYSGSNFILNDSGITLNNFTIDRSGNVTVNGSLRVNGDLTVTGNANLNLQGTGNVTGSLSTNGGYIGNGSGTYGGGTVEFTDEKAHIGPWNIDSKGIYTDDEASRLNPNGTMKLTSDGGVLNISGSSFSYRTKSSSGAGVVGTTSINIYQDYVYMGGGKKSYIVLGPTHFAIKNPSGHININDSHILIQNEKTSLEALSTGEIKIDGTYTCKQSQTVNLWKMFSQGTKLVFHKGLLVNEDLGEDDSNPDSIEMSLPLNVKNTISAYPPNKKTLTALGSLAFLDKVVVDSANFKIGSSNIASNITGNITISNKKLEDNTATYVLTIPGQSYTCSVGAESIGYSGTTSYSGSVTMYIWTNKSTGKYVGIYSNPPTGTNKSTYNSTEVSIPYSGTTRYSGSVKSTGGTNSGTTSTRYVKAVFSVKAT